VLKYYDVNTEITVSVDASSEGLGAVLLQGGQLVVYASRSLNQAERNYAHIEKEMLAIVYGCSKFHQYVYGNTTTVETDHKPLESLFKKSLSKAPQRVQIMMLKVQQYDLTVKYTPGKEMYITDTLSRASQPTTYEVNEEFEVHLLVNISDSKIEEFQEATNEDATMCKLREQIVTGWPKKMSDLVPELQ
jgi:hypothetical protein